MIPRCKEQSVRFPSFWARAKNATGRVVARGWSDVSQDEADANAQRRLDRILAYLRDQRPNPMEELDRYPYVADDVICEEVVQEIEAEGKVVAVLTRNAYGALVMNASQMMFIDLDFPWAGRSGCLFPFWRPKPPPQNPEATLRDRIAQWHSQHPELHVRVYRTKNGIRLIVTNQSFPTVEETSLAMMTELGADHLYVQLCRTQKCFRARLSPKPWRMGLKMPPSRFPFDKEADRAAYERWDDHYRSVTSQYGVCLFLESLGGQKVLPIHAPLIDLHDAMTCRESTMPLA